MKAVAGRPLRILDFDLENRPLSYWIPDRPTAEITAIAWAWADDPFNVKSTLLTRETLRVDFEAFLEDYDQADMVTGHYILRHDLPIIQSHLVEFDLPLLGEKLVSDTKVHLIGWKDIPKTQEHLCDMLGVSRPKVAMSQAKWREANRLTEKGLEATYERVVGDVLQHQEMRLELLKRGMLGAPRVWTP
jgi:hypothetical protein